jgi:hypothetical protein
MLLLLLSPNNASKPRYNGDKHHWFFFGHYYSRLH